jgi:hypothetical protein
MEDSITKKLRFLRQYGPIARNDNMYDETIQRAAKRAGVTPITFDHPQRADVQACFNATSLTSVILTGTAGDGKTHLCRQIWERLGGEQIVWASDEPYLCMTLPFVINDSMITLHVIRDLSAWVPQSHAEWQPEKVELLHLFCRSIYEPDNNVFLIAANDGQLIESWRRLPDTEYVVKVRTLLERLLVEDRQHEPDVRLEFFNLSRCNSATLLDLALKAFLDHEIWHECLYSKPFPDQAFGINCPIRHNYQLLQTPLVQKRLRALFELCDYNDVHIPIRQILLLLTNAVLGHPDVRDQLMIPNDVPSIIRKRTVAKASLYNNIFGGNLPKTRREALTIFTYLDRFRIGYETSNRVDNILIFGNADSTFRSYFEELLAKDKFYGAQEGYLAAQKNYVEGIDKDENVADFLQELVSQRRGLFFKIPFEQEDDLSLWDLTVFKYAGEYLSRVVQVVQSNRTVDHPIKARLVKGLNRIFVGMLINSEREVVLASGLSFSNARVNRLLEESISVRPHLGEKVEIILRDRVPTLNIVLSNTLECSLPLHLIRYEFLSRVAEGALPSSFSKECYEDILAYKSRLLVALAERKKEEAPSPLTTFKLLRLDDSGSPTDEFVELMEQIND